MRTVRRAEILRTWMIVLGFVAVYALQTSLLEHVTIWGVTPDLVLIAVCLFALRRGLVQGAVAGALAGFFIDLAGGRLVGLGAVAKSAAGAAVGWAGERVFGENVLVTVGLVAAGSLIEQAIYLFGAWAFGFPFPLAESIVRVALPSLWYDAAASVVIYPVFLLFQRRIGRIDSADRTGPVRG